ncbi:DNA-directed DNA polymerase I [Candidatus Thorarchaeota archaeon]|nr:MAG: DNA-directed DNA polymerase I [Candidatus Thorarchaeota archaeon]
MTEDNQPSLEEYMSSSKSESQDKASPASQSGTSTSTQSDTSSGTKQAPKSRAKIVDAEDRLDEEEIVDEDESVGEYVIGERDVPQNIPPSFLLSVDYDGQKAKAIARLYRPETKELFFWFDDTGHKPYCLTDFPPQVARQKVGRHPGFSHTETIQLQDLLRDEEITMTKVVAEDPLSIGGRQGAIRELLTERRSTGDPSSPYEEVSHAWEANIRYRNTYTYDREIVAGLMYKIENGSLIPCPPKLDQETLDEFKETLDPDEGLDRIISTYAPMFFTEVPDVKRLALDIEVYTPVKNRIPDAATAPYPVTAVGLSDNEGFNKCFVLERQGVDMGEKGPDYPEELEIVFYADERDMILEVFKLVDQYPILLTFVGDAFDLNYLYHRAKKLGIDVHSQCPIYLGREVALLKRGIHVDMYRFLKNPSVRIYALSGAYERNNLESIAQGVLGIGKLELSTEISDLPYYELAHYCWLDANITLRITTFKNNLLFRLIVLLMRISRLSMEDVTRQGISSWIQSLFRQEHRSRDALIPKRDDIESVKASEAQTEAMIKDKSFKGAIVIEPVAGVHFNTTVLDFASLYPTIMKRHNISYETVDCPHESCQNATDNRVPETNHWVCKKRTGMISETIGFFRDTRVRWFKQKSKDESLDERTRDWYSVVEKALKVFVNAAYGVTGAQHFELFCMPAAESVTAYGRNAILRTKEKAESMGVRVLYGDTDSVFLDHPTPEQQAELVKWSRDELGIDLEVEKTYKYVALSDRKKNYIGVYDSGHVEVKGLSGKKRNTPDFVQDAFREMLDVLSRVDNREGFKTAKVEIREIVNCVLDRLEGKAEPYGPEDLAFRVQMTKEISQYGKTTPQHVRAAIILRDAGYEVPSGTIVEYIKTKGPEGVLPVELAEEGAYFIDKDKYVDTLRSVFGQVLDSVGIDFEELMGFTTLDQFF